MGIRAKPHGEIWVTGASGFLGQMVLAVARQTFPDCTILAISNSVLVPTLPLSGIKSLTTDLKNPVILNDFWNAHPPEVVFHLAAATDPNWCQQNQPPAHALNVEASCRLADLCAARQVPLVFASTDLIFDGTKPPYLEEDLPAPVNWYGSTKWQAEKEIRRRHPEGGFICRFPLMFGPPSLSGRDPLGAVLKAFLGGPPATLFSDEFRTPVSTRAAAEGLITALKHQLPILHLGGGERVSRFEFAVRLGEWLGMPVSNLVAKKQSEVPMAAPRPPDVSLDSRLAFSLGYAPRILEEEFELSPYFRELKKRFSVTSR